MSEVDHGELKKVISGVGIITSFNRILLLQRSNDMRIYPGKWCLPGGKMERGECPSDAAIRETFEETNIRCKIRAGLEVVESPLYEFGICNVIYPFIMSTKSSWFGMLDYPTDEHIAAGWFTIEEALNLDLAGKTGDIIKLYDILYQSKSKRG